jgi:hypothetical protein
MEDLRIIVGERHDTYSVRTLLGWEDFGTDIDAAVGALPEVEHLTVRMLGEGWHGLTVAGVLRHKASIRSLAPMALWNGRFSSPDNPGGMCRA